MGQEFLVIEQIDAGADFLRQFNDYAPISVACWVKPADSDNLFLYIASDEIDDGNIGVAYGEVLRRLHASGSQWLDPFQIKLVNSSHPIARDAIAVRDRRFVPQIPTRYNASSLGGLAIDGAYIYPSLPAMKSTP